MWSVLKWSLSQRFDYWLQLSYPSDVKQAAALLDRKLWKVLEVCVGSSVPEGGESDCVMEGPVSSIQGLSFQQMVTRLPIKMGGMGIRNQEQLRLAAFVGSVEQCVPQIGSRTGLCPALAPQFGGDECFGNNMPVDSRWEVLISSGCRLGQEFLEAWRAMRDEAVGLTEWLGEELDGALIQSVRGAGLGCVTGATRKLVVEQIEQMEKSSEEDTGYSG